MKKRCVRCKLEYPEEETECEICRLPLVPVEEEAPKAQAEEKSEDAGSDMTEGEPSQERARGVPYQAPLVTFFRHFYVVVGWIAVVVGVLYTLVTSAYWGWRIEGFIASLPFLIAACAVFIVNLVRGNLLGMMQDTNQKLSDGGPKDSAPYDSRALRFVSKVYPVMAWVLIVLGCLGIFFIFLSYDRNMMPLAFVAAILGVQMLMESQQIGLLVDTNRKAIR